MWFIVKTNPLPLREDSALVMTLPTFYGGEMIAQGDSFYLWFSETAGGGGLAGRGLVLSVACEGRRRTVTLHIEGTPVTPLANLLLEPHRDNQVSPEGMLSRKLYRHSHNKIAGIGDAERTLLEQFF